MNNLNQYTSANGSSASSDIKGNLESYNGWIYTYDAQNRLRSAVNGGASVELWYDGLNRQITRRINGSAIVRSVWDGWNLLEERDGNDAPLQYYLHGARPDELVVRWASIYGEDTWYAQDGRGNISHLYNYSGFVERYTYGLGGDPRIFDAAGTLRLESAIANRFMFVGRDYHKQLGIYDYRNRFYHPALNRFLQTDPIGMQFQGAKLTSEQKAFYSPGGLAPEAFSSSEFNLYRYCHNDPVNKTDSMGLLWSIDPKMSPEYTQRTRDQIARARTIDNRIDDAFRAMEQDQSKMDVFTQAGPEGNQVETRYNWFGKPIGATIYYDPDNWKVDSGYRDPVIGLAHEVPHIPDANRGDLAPRFSKKWVEQEAKASRPSPKNGAKSGTKRQN